MPHRPKGSDWFKTRITLGDGRTGIYACGTTSQSVADDVDRMVRTFSHDRVWGPLAIVVDRKASLGAVYDAFKLGTLDAFLSAFGAPDISALIEKWPAKSAKYKTQVRCMIPAGTQYPATRFTKLAVADFLDRLTCSGSTKNRYHAALSAFGKWLTRRNIIETNIVRDVERATPNACSPRWLDRVQAKALVGALPMPYRAIEALMASCGVEWQVIERLTRRDIDLKAKTVHARGGKTAWRNRVVRATELWAWRIFADYAKEFTDNAQLFPVSKFRALDEHLDAAGTLKLPRTTLHDWRHTYAVLSLKAGYSLQVVAHQLGHRDTTLVQSRYGRFTPDESDYTRHPTKPLSRRERPRGRKRSGLRIA